jgi:hypothetical protein
MNKLTVAAAFLSAFLTAPLCAQLWRQDPINSFGGLSSQDARNPGGLGWFSEVADNFEGERGWRIENVEFWGGYAAVEPGNTEGFTIRIYEDNAGSIGARIFEQDVFTFTETEYYVHPSLGFPGYHTEVDLDPEFVVPENGTYWISIVAILARGGGAMEPQWGWIDALGVNAPFCQQWFFSPGNFNPQTRDVAFALNGFLDECYADCDLNQVFDIFDFLCFQDAFVAMDPYADCDGNSVFDVFDFLCFQDAFVNGCP